MRNDEVMSCDTVLRHTALHLACLSCCDSHKLASTYCIEQLFIAFGLETDLRECKKCPIQYNSVN